MARESHATSTNSASLAWFIPEDFGQSVHLLEEGGRSGDAAAAGFLLSYLARICSRSSPAVWITHSAFEREGGRLYGPGLSAMAFDPGALLLVRAQRTQDVLWAMEEALRSGAVCAVVGEIDKPGSRLDLTATRRLALRSERAGVPAYILVAHGASVGATAARTRLRVASTSSVPTPSEDLLGPPSWTVDQIKNKKGSCGTGAIAYDPARGAHVSIEKACSPPQTRNAQLSNGGGAVVAFPRRSARKRSPSA